MYNKKRKSPKPKMKNFKESVVINVKGVCIILRTDKNGQICDIQPRLGYLHSNYQGRPLSLIPVDEFYEEAAEILNSLPREEFEKLLPHGA